MNKVRSILIDNLDLYAFMARNDKPEAIIGYDTNDHRVAKQSVEDFDKLITTCVTLRQAYSHAPDKKTRKVIAEALGLPRGVSYPVSELRRKAVRQFRYVLSVYG